MENKVRLRYAPSPTGKLHLGGARTALFNYLYAKHNNGYFIIRIEDTDIDRNIENGESEQIDYLKWLGVEPDIYPGNDLDLEEFKLLRQSERLDIYKKYVEQLLEEGKAYKCYCSKEELEEEREAQIARGIKSPKYSKKCFLHDNYKEGVEPTIRIHIPDNLSLSWDDGVRGKITVDSNEIEDWIIQKSNGMPTYNFANVIDDHLMKITHVMRGEEHISNTPKQVHLYEIFNWEVPHFSHLTIITGENNKKLSKRDESVVQFISDYKRLGYLPEAIFNFLSLLGWSPPKVEEELFSAQEIIEMFSLERLSKSPSKFDLGKLRWINNQYLQNLNKEEAFEFLNPFLNSKIKEIYDLEQQKAIVELYREQLHEGIELNELSKLFVTKPKYLEEETEYLSQIDYKQKVQDEFIVQLNTIEDWNIESIKLAIKQVGKNLEIKGKDLFKPIRILVTGSVNGPGLIPTIELLGKEEVVLRVREEK